MAGKTHFILQVEHCRNNKLKQKTKCWKRGAVQRFVSQKLGKMVACRQENISSIKFYSKCDQTPLIMHGKKFAMATANETTIKKHKFMFHN